MSAPSDGIVPGAMVRYRPTGRDMTVVSRNNDRVVCRWYNDVLVRLQATLDVGDLELLGVPVVHRGARLDQGE